MIPPYIKTNIIHFSFPTHHAFVSSNEYLLNIISSQLDWHHSQRLPEHYWRESVDAAETESQKASSPHWPPRPCHNRKDGSPTLHSVQKTAQPLYTKIKLHTEIPNHKRGHPLYNSDYPKATGHLKDGTLLINTCLYTSANIYLVIPLEVSYIKKLVKVILKV